MKEGTGLPCSILDLDLDGGIRVFLQCGQGFYQKSSVSGPTTKKVEDKVGDFYLLYRE